MSVWDSGFGYALVEKTSDGGSGTKDQGVTGLKSFRGCSQFYRITRIDWVFLGQLFWTANHFNAFLLINIIFAMIAMRDYQDLMIMEVINEF